MGGAKPQPLSEVSLAGLSRALGLCRRELVLVTVEAESSRQMWDVATGFVKLNTGHHLDSLKSSRRQSSGYVFEGVSRSG